VTEQGSKVKSFVISKRVVWKAWEQVKADQDAAGVDGESVAEFERNLEKNLYEVWNRMSSGTYAPPVVRAVRISKRHRLGVGTLGMLMVADRVAQTVVKLYLESGVKQFFSVAGAVGKYRKRCDWVIDLDLRSFFDSLNHESTLGAVAAHTDERWIFLYVERWLKAPFYDASGILVVRDCGIPQGSVLSPVLADLFMHYVFDAWMVWEFPDISFERYADGMVVYCVSERQAWFVLRKIERRLAESRLDLNLGKVHIKEGRPAQIQVTAYKQQEDVELLQDGKGCEPEVFCENCGAQCPRPSKHAKKGGK
jgi:RNA-directed DNA polymerase